MLWLALHCPTRPTSDSEAASLPDASATPAAAFPTPTLACWAGRYTSHVNLASAALRLEISGSLRLFGGLPALLQQVREDLAAMDLALQLAVAATPLARRVEGCGLRRVGARLGKAFAIDLARAPGEIADPQTCFVFPEQFEQDLELPAPVDAAPVLLFAAHRLIAALSGWLAARNGAVREIECLIDHGHGVGTALPPAFSAPVHAVARIERVLKERLDALSLPAPALALRLNARDVVPREHCSLRLFDGAGRRHEALADLMDRLVARLGPQAVQGLACHADHRPERASRPVSGKPASSPVVPPPRPLWLVDPPEALRELRGRPQRGGALTLAAGPERIESGWWDGADARRDYFIAIDGTGRRLWIFRDPRPRGGWFLHGWFA